MAKEEKSIISELLRKDWSADKVHQMVGQFSKSYFAYAADEGIRKNAASGGVATAILAYLLDHDVIDGALVCRSIIKNGKVYPEFFIAADKLSLAPAQGSKYMAVNFNRDALPLIKAFKGNLAVTLLPCDTSTLRRAVRNDEALAKKIKLVITLFCGHNSTSDLTDMVVKKLSPKNAELTFFRHRQGHWRGELHAEFRDGKVIEKPFSFFSDYQNLYFFCQQKCHHCRDHTGYEGDISIGDIWSQKMKEEAIKHSAVITRSPAGKEIFNRVVNAGVLTANEEPIEEICKGQARSMPFHYNVTARTKAGRLLGINIKDTVYAPVRWNEFIAAWMAIFNEKLSRSTAGRRLIGLTPRFLLKILLYFMKGLESI